MMNTELLNAFISAASACAHEMMENGLFIEQELFANKISDGYISVLSEAYSGIVGTKFDIINELGELEEVAARPQSAEVQNRVNRIVGLITDELWSLHAVVKNLEAASETDHMAQSAYMLVAESAVNIVHKFENVKKAAKDCREAH